MAVTRLKRKELRNKINSKKRTDKIKSLTHLPPIKKVDVEQIKEEFAKKSGKKSDTKKKEDTTAVEREPAKVKADVKKEDAPVEKEPAKTQVKDTPVTDASKDDKGSSEE